MSGYCRIRFLSSRLPSQATDDRHSVGVHDVEELVPDVEGPLQVLLLDEVLLAPLHRHLVPLPLLEHVEQSQVVALKGMVHPDKLLSKSAKQKRMTSLISRYLVVVECPLLVIRLFCPLLRPQEDVLVRRQHRNDRQHLLHCVKG